MLEIEMSHTVRKWIYIGHKLPRTFDCSHLWYKCIQKMLRKINLNKEKNLVPQGGTVLMYHTKLVHFCMFIVQNSTKIFTFLQILSFLKNSPWNLKISYILRLSTVCMNEEKWKKSQEIKFYIDLFSNSVKGNQNLKELPP